jgi:hypothetical protein
LGLAPRASHADDHAAQPGIHITMFGTTLCVGDPSPATPCNVRIEKTRPLTFTLRGRSYCLGPATGVPCDTAARPSTGVIDRLVRELRARLGANAPRSATK